MTSQRDIERYLDDWLGSAPIVAADRVVNVVSARIPHQRQRAAWRVRPVLGRRGTMTFAAAAAAVLVGTIAFALYSTGQPPTPSPSWPAPSGSPSAPPTAAPTGEPAMPALTPGTYTTGLFAVPFSFTVFEGWSHSPDDETAFTLAWTAAGGLDAGGIAGFELLYDAYPVELDASGNQTMSEDPWSKPHAPRDLIAALEDRPCFDTTASPTEVGGRRAWDIDLVVENDCDDRHPVWVIHWHDGIPATLATGPGLMEFTIIEGPDDSTMVLWVRDNGDPAFQVAVASVIGRIAFEPAKGPLEPGDHRSEFFDLDFRYTVPSGWSRVNEDDGFMALSGSSEGAYVGLRYGVYPAACTGLELNDPHGPDDLVRDIQTRIDLTTTAERVSIGGLEGWTVRAIPSGQPRQCPFGYFHVPPGGGSPRPFVDVPRSFIVLGGGAGSTLLITTEGDDAASLAEADAVVSSFDFGP